MEKKKIGEWKKEERICESGRRIKNRKEREGSEKKIYEKIFG